MIDELRKFTHTGLALCKDEPQQHSSRSRSFRYLIDLLRPDLHTVQGSVLLIKECS